MLVLRRLLYRQGSAYDVPLPADILQLYPLITQQPSRSIEILKKMATLYRPSQHRDFFTPDKIKKIDSILLPYMGGQGRKDKIATVAWIIKKLELTKQYKELLDEIVRRVENDEWYVNFEESLLAMEAFTKLIKDKTLRDDIYQKIQRNVFLTIWEENMKVYERVTTALIDAGRLDAPLWDKIEYHVLRNLDMDYDPQTMVNLFLNFSKAQRGNEQFYLMLQHSLMKGHMFQRAMMLQSNIDHSLSSQLIVPIFETYSIQANNGLQLLPEFQAYLTKLINHPRFRLESISDLSRLTRAISSGTGLGFDEEHKKQLIQKAVDKIYTLQENYVAMGDVIQFYEMTRDLGFLIPPKVQEKLQLQVAKSILQGPKDVTGVMQLYAYLIKNEDQSNEILQSMIEGWIQVNSRYFDTASLRQISTTMRLIGKPIQIKGDRVVLLQKTQTQAKKLLR